MKDEKRDGSNLGVGNRNDRNNEHEAKPEQGSHGIPEKKKNAGGAAQVNSGGPRLTEAVLNPAQKKAKDYTTRSENGNANPKGGH